MPRFDRFSYFYYYRSLFMRRFNVRLLASIITLFSAFIFSTHSNYFLILIASSPSARSHAITLMLFICPTFVDTESFSLHFSCVSRWQGMISSYIAPFRSFPIFPHLRAHLDKLLREPHIYPLLVSSRSLILIFRP